MKRGFTIIELLFVTFIIGILASIILANFGPAKRQARDSQHISDVAQIQAALEGYFQNPRNGNTYPPIGRVEALANNQPKLPCVPYTQGSFAQGGLNCLTVPTGNTSGYLPDDPKWTTIYDYYSCDPNNSTSDGCRNTDAASGQGYYQAYCVGTQLEDPNDVRNASEAATQSCLSVTWCDIKNHPENYNSGQGDNYIVCHK